MSIRNTPKFYARIEEIFVLYRNRFRTLDQMLARSGANSNSPFFCGAQLTIADISLDTAPKPGLFKRLFGWLFGKKSSEKYAVAEPAASKGPSSGKETQVCGLQ